MTELVDVWVLQTPMLRDVGFDPRLAHQENIYILIPNIMWTFH